MNRTTRIIDATPQAIFDVLSDGWTYATWVVGAARIRRVDADFPAPGCQVHHSVGAWPVLLSDNTGVVAIDAPREILLRVRAWPAGEGEVRLTCHDLGDGRTEVVMRETAVNGPVTLVPKPLEDRLLRGRNAETLRRLAYLAESGARSEHGPRERTRT